VFFLLLFIFPFVGGGVGGVVYEVYLLMQDLDPVSLVFVQFGRNITKKHMP
jgi:hypothetical protein